jgi:hypothetical protein
MEIRKSGTEVIESEGMNLELKNSGMKWQSNPALRASTSRQLITLNFGVRVE